VAGALAHGDYAGALWLEGSPFVEETAYWLNLLIDTRAPIVGIASQRAHGAVGNDGDRNIIDGVEYIVSRIWTDPQGLDCVGVVVMQDEQIFTAREVQKADARPGGYTATGGHGGIVGTIGHPGPPVLTFRPVRLHTHRSALALSRLPEKVKGVRKAGERIEAVEVGIKDEQGKLLGTGIPLVTILKHARYLPADASGNPDREVDILAQIDRNLTESPLAGFVGEGAAPYGSMTESAEAALERAVLSGMPVVKVGRGNAEGMTPYNRGSLFLGGNNLTATKARLLLMASLLKFGALPAASDPRHPTKPERDAVLARIVNYQAIFDTH
jgi:L-asparaginase/Glu-tRNA(Gln) amidotransferase subunit D